MVRMRCARYAHWRRMAASSLGPSGVRLIGLLGESSWRPRNEQRSASASRKCPPADAWARMTHLRVNSRHSQSSTVGR
eukprot:5268128-Alexandrium_andersonii.AAC.1